MQHQQEPGANAFSGPGHSLEFVATFGANTSQHVGFGNDLNSAPWAIFSTGYPGGTSLLARTNDGVDMVETDLGGAYLGTPHRYRIDWTATSVTYSIDDVLVAVHAKALTADMRPLASDQIGGLVLTLDWLRMSPYATSGVFVSRVLDAGATAHWLSLTTLRQQPLGTAVTIETRTGDTANPQDDAWSTWTTVSNTALSGVDSRYLQYRLMLSSILTMVSPAVHQVVVAYQPPANTAIITTTAIHYTYDPLYRLTDATYSTGEQFQYAYDAVGNRTVQTRTITNTQVTAYQYDAANRLINAGGVANTWDNNGNLINDGSATYLYDRANRMISTTQSGVTSLYAYNGDGARLKQIVAGVVTTYTQDMASPLPVVVQVKTGTATTQYLYAFGTRPLAQNGGAWEYLLPDALGSVRQIADANGNVTLAESYEPYGSVLTSTGTASSIFAYAGEQADTSGLIYLRARYMNPRLGLFLARDPWSGEAMRPGSMNGWRYAEGEPINHTDPSGQWALDISPKVSLVAEVGDSWDTFLAGFYGKEVNVEALNSWFHLNWHPKDPEIGTRIDITSWLDPLIAKTAELGGGMEKTYYPPNVDPFNCYPTALTCAASECQYHEYPYYDIDDFLRDNSLNIEHEADLRYGDIFRIGGDDGGKRPDGRPAFYNAPIHYGMILWRSGTTDKIWTFNGQITSYAFIAQLPDVLAYYRTEYPERNIIGVPKLEDPRGDLGPMHSKGYYRLNLSVSAAQIAQWIDEHKKLNSSK